MLINNFPISAMGQFAKLYHLIISRKIPLWMKLLKYVITIRRENAGNSNLIGTLQFRFIQSAEMAPLTIYSCIILGQRHPMFQKKRTDFQNPTRETKENPIKMFVGGRLVLTIVGRG